MSKKIFIDNDQFYTKPETVDICMFLLYKFLKNNDIDLLKYTVIEPSVGSGNFYKKIPNGVDKIAIDLYPEEKFIKEYPLIKCNYLEYVPDSTNNKKYIIKEDLKNNSKISKQFTKGIFSLSLDRNNIKDFIEKGLVLPIPYEDIFKKEE